MRTPTPIDVQLAWWRNAVTTGNFSRDTDEMPCGWFKTREKPRSKTWIPARIWLLQSIDWETAELSQPETYVLEIAGQRWTDQLQIYERSLYLKPVSMDQWRWLTARLALRNGSQVITSTYDWHAHKMT